MKQGYRDLGPCHADSVIPQLTNLQLGGNYLSINGLLAILDGCRRLETLDVRVCHFDNLWSTAFERSAQNVKYLLLASFFSFPCSLCFLVFLLFVLFDVFV